MVLDARFYSPSEVAELFPFADVSGIRAGFYAENDGRINPVDVTMASPLGPVPAAQDCGVHTAPGG